MTITCYLDIEGGEPCAVEVGLIIFDRLKRKILFAKVFYGAITNERDFEQGQRFCHGMTRNFLKVFGMDQTTIHKQLREILEEWNVEEVVGNGSDIGRYLKIAGISLPYRDCPLPIWAKRYKDTYHSIARSTKFKSLQVARAYCDFAVVHSHRIACKKWTQEIHEGHCALYDSLEVLMYDNEFEFLH